MSGSIQQILRWLLLGVVFPLIFLNGWLSLKLLQYFQPLVTILVLAALIGFILNYPVRFLQQRGLGRNYAVLLIFLVSGLFLTSLGITLVPRLIQEFQQIAHLLPDWIESGNQEIQVLQEWIVNHHLPVSLGQLLTQVSNRLPEEAQALLDQLGTLVLDTVDSLSEVLLTLVLAFYFLLDGERLWNSLFCRLPSRVADPVKQSLQLNFQNYFKGQIVLALLVGLSMTLAFLCLQLPSALLFGLGIGVMTLIPFGDVVSFIVIGLLVGTSNFWLGVKVLAIAVVIDQIIDQLIAPRLLGSFTGLRPIWVLISLLVGVKVAGLIGLLTAVPLASVLNSALGGFEELDPKLSGLSDASLSEFGYAGENTQDL